MNAGPLPRKIEPLPVAWWLVLSSVTDTLISTGAMLKPTAAETR